MHPSALAERFLTWLRQEAHADRTAPRTVSYYEHELSRWIETMGPFAPNVEDMRPCHLIGQGGESRNRIQAVKRLTKWADEMGWIPSDPFRRVKLPPIGRRNRTLTRDEMRRLYLASTRPWRRFLFIMRHTIARPGEIRGLRWRQVDLLKRRLILSEFKGQNRRKDRLHARLIPLSRPATRLLSNMRRRTDPEADDLVFLGRYGQPLTKEAVRCAIRRARLYAGLAESGKEQVCAYTIRHTAATEATRHGLRDRVLADVMGHTTTRTTARYQHLAGDDLVDAIDEARAREAAKRIHRRESRSA